MSMTPEQKQLHQQYQNSNESVRTVVDAAFHAASEMIIKNGMSVSFDDRAEIFVAAIYKYVVDSAE